MEVADSRRRENIRRKIQNLMPEVLQGTMENALKRAQMVVHNCGGHLIDIFFKTSYALKNVSENFGVDETLRIIQNGLILGISH